MMIEFEEELCRVGWICDIKHCYWDQVVEKQADFSWNNDSYKGEMKNHLQHSEHREHENHGTR